jgi:biotin carboxyl carrier protein
MTEQPQTMRTLLIEDREYETLYTGKFERRRQYSIPDPKKLHCVIPGVILRIHVQPGRKVQRDEPLLILEAMKMQNDILSPIEGKVKTVHVEVGAMVPRGTLLIEFE